MEQKIEDASKEHFEKHGKRWDYGPIDLQPEIEKLKSGLSGDDKAVSFVSFLSLTHSYKKEFHRIKSNLSTIPFGQKSSSDLLEIFDHTPNTDKYFTRSAVFQLSTVLDINGIVLANILMDDKTEPIFREYLTTELIDIDRNEAKGYLELVQSFEGFYPTFLKFQRTNHDDLSSMDKYEIYSNSLFMITLIEKILRRVAVNRNSETIYFSEADLNLGDVLKTRNSDGSEYVNGMLNNIFDLELIRTLEYYLVKTADTNIGINIRNNLAHNRNIAFLKLEAGFPRKIFYLFLSVVNAIYSGYINHNNFFRQEQTK